MAELPIMQGQKQLLQLYKELQAWALENQFPLYMAGLALHNAFGAESAEKEISTVGLFSMLSIILLVVFCFRSAIPLFLAMLSVGFGVLAGFTVSLYCFAQLHIITLVFGSSLIGISIDYAFHYFADFFNQSDESASQRLVRVFPGISLGMLSSVLAYFALSLTPFPGLRQIAVFSAAGLIAAWCSVVLLMPFCLQDFKLKHTLPWQGFYHLYNERWPRFAKKYRWILLLVVSAYCLFAWLNLQPVDDIREIQQPKAELLVQEESIKRLLNYQQDSQFFIVKAQSLAALWQQESLLIKGLQQGIVNGDVGGYSALSDIYPSTEQQQVSINLLDAAFFQTQHLRQMLEELGMDELAIAAIENEFAAEKHRPLSFEHWLAQMPEPQQAQFLGCADGVCASVVHLNSLKSLVAMKTLAAAQPAVLFVDPIANINSVLFHYRSMAAYFILLAAGGITLLLMFFLGLRSALIIISAPLLAILLTVASLYYLQATFSLFNVFALLLVLGISLDYAIFQHLGSSHKSTTALAILLSLLTTFMAFGILALSSTAVIQAFGLSLAIGISFAFLIAALLPAKKG
jgi:predicted exporter